MKLATISVTKLLTREGFEDLTINSWRRLMGVWMVGSRNVCRGLEGSHWLNQF